MMETKTPSRRGQEACSLLTFSSWLSVRPDTTNNNRPATNPALELAVLILDTTTPYFNISVLLSSDYVLISGRLCLPWLAGWVAEADNINTLFCRTDIFVVVSAKLLLRTNNDSLLNEWLDVFILELFVKPKLVFVLTEDQCLSNNDIQSVALYEPDGWDVGSFNILNI